MTAITNGSRNERWFEATMAGPVAGMRPRPVQQGLPVHALGYQRPQTRLQLFDTVSLDVGRTARGALAGAVAAGVWAAQSPLDQRVFGVPYLDQELLGKAVTRGRAWHPVGFALHVANGALFGAVY